MWVCTRFNRPFKRKQQSHSCVELDEYHLFKRSNTLVRALYEELKLRMADFPDYIISPVEKPFYLKKLHVFKHFHPKGWFSYQFLFG